MQLSFVELELQGVLSFPKRVLGTKLWSSPRTVSVLNSKTMSPNVWTPTCAEVTAKLYSPFSPTFKWGGAVISLHC